MRRIHPVLDVVSPVATAKITVDENGTPVEEADPSRPVQVLGLSDAYETGTGFLVTPVIGWLDAAPTVTPSPDEVAEVFETPWDFLMDAANHRRDFYDMDEGLRRWFWAMPWGERYIWGVTAGILKGLHARLYGDETHPAAAADEDAA